MPDSLSPTLRAVSDAVLAVAAAQVSVEDVLQQLVDSARELVSAGYAALGLPDGEGGFRSFLTSGMGDELVASLGPLPRQHGILGAMLGTERPYRTRDLRGDPRFRGWWPGGHPEMRSFLGVPIVAAEGVIGAFYLTEKLGEPDFLDADEELIGLLAAHAAIAIANARLFEQSRELSVLAERNRLALELHDAVSQKLFGLVLSAKAAETLLSRDPAGARAEVAKLGVIAQDALDELRSLVFELRPADLERDGLGAALRTHVDVLRRVRQREITLDIGEGLNVDPVRDREVFRIAQEALQNAIRHAAASRVVVRLQAAGGGLLLEVRDDGIGFDPHAPELRSRRLGLTSMEERARRIAGLLEIDSSAANGTTVRLEVGCG